MGWSKEEFNKSSPRELWACYYQYALIKGWCKTKAQVKREENEKIKESIKSLKAMKGKG